MKVHPAVENLKKDMDFSHQVAEYLTSPPYLLESWEVSADMVLPTLGYGQR